MCHWLAVGEKGLHLLLLRFEYYFTQLNERISTYSFVDFSGFRGGSPSNKALGVSLSCSPREPMMMSKDLKRCLYLVCTDSIESIS